MKAQIRPNRLDVSDRFPMLGFTIRVSEAPARAEVALATDPALFAPEAKARRGPGNFYSSRVGGELRLPRGEGVWLAPPEALAALVGADRLYVALAVGGETGPLAPLVVPTGASPYVSISGLSGRSLRRVRVMPSRIARPGPQAYEWAGDQATPGMTPAPPAANRPITPAPYDDGFGPLPEPAAQAPVPAGEPGPQAGTPAAAAAAGAARSLSLGDDRRPVEPPSVDVLGTAARVAAEAALALLPAPLGPMIAALRTAPRLSAAAGLPVSIGIGRPPAAGSAPAPALGSA